MEEYMRFCRYKNNTMMGLKEIDVDLKNLKVNILIFPDFTALNLCVSFFSFFLFSDTC